MRNKQLKKCFWLSNFSNDFQLRGQDLVSMFVYNEMKNDDQSHLILSI